MVSGSVKDERGLPVPDIPVVAEEALGVPAEAAGDDLYWAERAEVARTRSDAGGGFLLPGLPAVPLFVRIELSGAPLFELVSEDPWVGSRGLAVRPHGAPVAFVLRRRFVLRMDVLDAYDRRPLLDARVEGLQYRFDDGVLSVFLSRPGAHVLRVAASGYVPTSISVDVPAASQGAYHQLPEAVLLERGAVVAGRILDSEGHAVARALVSFERLNEPIPQPSVVLGQVSDPAGRYRFDGLRTGRYRYRVLAEKSGVARGSLELGGGTIERDFFLPKVEEEGAPPEREWQWSERRDVRLAFSTSDMSCRDLLVWLEELTGTRLRVAAGAAERLGTVTISPDFGSEGASARAILRLLGQVGGLNVDEETGALALPHGGPVR